MKFLSVLLLVGFLSPAVPVLGNKRDPAAPLPASVITLAPPTANDATLVQCDNSPIDGFSSFNLNEAIPQITGGAAGVSVAFFLTMTDAQNNVMAVNAANFTNTVNPQILYARVQDTMTGEFAVSQLTLNVQNNMANDALINACDEDGVLDGFHPFTLSNADDDILFGLVGVYTITYYETINNAFLENNPLNDNYINQSPYFQQIFARVESGNDCFDIVTVSLNVITPPQLSADAEVIYCLNDFPATINLSSGLIGGDGSEAFSWSNGAITENIDINTAGLYTVTVTNIDGCFSMRTINVIASNIATIDSITTDTCNLSSNIQINVSGEGVYEYALNNAAGPYQNSNQFTNLAPGAYTVYVRDVNGCGTVQEDIVLSPPVVIAPDETVVYCLNTFPATITISSGLINPEGTETFLWSTGANTESIDINATGDYTITVTSAGGCMASRTIAVAPSAIATILSAEVTDFSDNNTITVTVSGEGDYEYSLNNPIGSFQDSNYFSHVAAGIHTVYVRDKNGCGVAQQEVTVVGYPKFFTPNGDGINDSWQLAGIDGLFQPTSRIFIFDRYGKVIAQLNPASSWDGSYNGRPLPSSDYWFRIELEDGRQFKGHFTLKR